MLSELELRVAVNPVSAVEAEVTGQVKLEIK
jgi:hypothetical protein